MKASKGLEKIPRSTSITVFFVVMKRKFSVAWRYSQSRLIRGFCAIRTRSATLYSLLKASRCISLPSQDEVSRSSSTHEILSGTASSPTLFTFEHISLGVENVIPLALACAGTACRNWRILLDSGWAIPRAESSMNMLMTCSSSGSCAIRSI